MEPAGNTAERYRRFARQEARDRSPLYAVLCEGVSEDGEVLAWLDRFPAHKRQPTLLLAALRYCCGTQDDYRSFRTTLLANREEVAQTMLTRRVQTNEVGRCAVLLPALALMPQPLAILEVGTAAGLCLLLDRFGYDYGGHRVGPAQPSFERLPAYARAGVQSSLRPDALDPPVVLSCRPIGAVPLPAAVPEVVWRAGMDIAPLNAADGCDRAWLEALVWPDQPERLARLRAALRMAAADPPPIVRGNLVDGLRGAATAAPRDATLVVFHSATLGYLSDAEHAGFAAEVARLGALWLSNEGLSVLPGVSAPPVPGGVPGGSQFVLVQGGHRALALAHPHGDWLAWADDRGDPTGRAATQPPGPPPAPPGER